MEGSHYEVGQQLADFISQNPKAKQVFTSGTTDLKKLGYPDFPTLWNYCEACCKGITDEIQGFADGLNTSPETVPFWNWTFAPSLGGECSQVAVLASATQEEQPLVGRSYEWNHTDEDLKLITTRVKGKASHLGFSCILFGRHDGLNEHGLVVSMTGGGIFGVPFKHRGPMFWLAIRALLDSCASVENALQKLKTLPLTGYCSLLFADKYNHAAIVEIADGTQSVIRVPEDGTEPYLFSVNHFRLPEMQIYNKLNCGIITHSQQREALITNWYKTHTPKITKGDLQDLFAAQHPKGLCNHFYNDGFGTLWSMIFRPTRCEVDACFGAPTHNSYFRFGLDDPLGITAYPTLIPITKERL
ncbi:MAG: C45 family autoproteolytic acyltransferase/hydrolase [Candidatus Hodarchaeota archaeon]